MGDTRLCTITDSCTESQLGQGRGKGTPVKCYNDVSSENSIGLDVLLVGCHVKVRREGLGSMDQPLRYIFETTDWRGRPVRMTIKTYDLHKDRHAEMPEYIQDVQTLIGDPDEIYIADSGPSLHLYRFGLGRGIHANTYLTAIVYYPEEKGSGLVASYFCRSRLPRLKLLERRYVHLNGVRVAEAEYRRRIVAELAELSSLKDAGEGGA